MSNLIELKVPDIGNDVEVEVAEVLIQTGDTIELEQTILTLESDKATMDLPASAAGVIQEVKVAVGDNIAEGAVVATVAVVEGAEVKADPQPAEAEANVAVAEPEPETPAAQPVAAPDSAPPAIATSSVSGKAHATPAVRRFARELGVDISAIKAGAGRKGRILKDDVKNYVKQVMSSGVAATGGAGIPPIPEVGFFQVWRS